MWRRLGVLRGALRVPFLHPQGQPPHKRGMAALDFGSQNAGGTMTKMIGRNGDTRKAFRGERSHKKTDPSSLRFTEDAAEFVLEKGDNKAVPRCFCEPWNPIGP